MGLRKKIAVAVAATLLLNATTLSAVSAQAKSDDQDDVYVLPDWWLEVFCDEGGPAVGADYHVCTLPGGDIVLCIPGDGGDWYCAAPAPEEDPRPWATAPTSVGGLSGEPTGPVTTTINRSGQLLYAS